MTSAPYLLIIFSIFFCLEGLIASTYHKQYIVSFNVQLNQWEQQKYLHEVFPIDSFEYVFRKYIPQNMSSDFAVIHIASDQSDWLVSAASSANLIKSFHEDSLTQSRELLSKKGADSSESGIEEGDEKYFEPASLISSFSKVGVRGAGVKIAIFDTGEKDDLFCINFKFNS
jgi:hypothetical protein